MENQFQCSVMHPKDYLDRKSYITDAADTELLNSECVTLDGIESLGLRAGFSFLTGWLTKLLTGWSS